MGNVGRANPHSGFMPPIPPRRARLNLPISDALKALFATPSDESLERYNNQSCPRSLLRGWWPIRRPKDPFAR